MAYQPIFLGGTDNDDTGDAPKIAGDKINDNFVELYSGTTTVTAGTPRTASGTLVLAEAGTIVEMNVASANTITIPPNSSVAFPIGTIIEVCQIGAGTTTVVAGSGVTLRLSGTAAIRAQWASVSLRKRGTDEWVVSGDTA